MIISPVDVSGRITIASFSPLTASVMGAGSREYKGVTEHGKEDLENMLSVRSRSGREDTQRNVRWNSNNAFEVCWRWGWISSQQTQSATALNQGSEG